MEYKDYNDNELLMYISEKSDEATSIIQKKYEPYIIKYASFLMGVSKKIGLEFNDLYQEGLVGLNLAIENFDEKQNTSFYTFAITCIKRSMLNIYNKAINQKQEILNNAFSIDDENNKDKLECYFAIQQTTPEKYVIDKCDSDSLKKQIYDKLTNIEKKVFELRLKGFTYKEIGKIMQKDYKIIDNAIQRIRMKSKNILADYYS